MDDKSNVQKLIASLNLQGGSTNSTNTGNATNNNTNKPPTVTTRTSKWPPVNTANTTNSSSSSTTTPVSSVVEPESGAIRRGDASTFKKRPGPPLPPRSDSPSSTTTTTTSNTSSTNSTNSTTSSSSFARRGPPSIPAHLSPSPTTPSSTNTSSANNNTLSVPSSSSSDSRPIVSPRRAPPQKPLPSTPQSPSSEHLPSPPPITSSKNNNKNNNNNNSSGGSGASRAPPPVKPHVPPRPSSATTAATNQNNSNNNTQLPQLPQLPPLSNNHHNAMGMMTMDSPSPSAASAAASLDNPNSRVSVVWAPNKPVVKLDPLRMAGELIAFVPTSSLSEFDDETDSTLTPTTTTNNAGESALTEGSGGGSGGGGEVSAEIVAMVSRPTSAQVKAAITIQKCVRKRLATKKVKAMKSRAFHRHKCVEEILSTEKTYLEGLRVLNDVYLEKLKEKTTGPNPIITDFQITQIFSDIKVILNVNEAFYQQLEERLAQYDNHKTIISDIFATMSHFFKTYARYCNNFEKSQSVLSFLKANNLEFKNELAQLDKHPRASKLGVQSFLILPIQRIPRYRLLMQDLIKHTEKDHPDYEGLSKALDSIKLTADHLNKTMKAIDATNEVLSIQNQFAGSIPQKNRGGADRSGGESKGGLVEPHRKFIAHWRMKELETNAHPDSAGNDLALHLFNDVLVFSYPYGETFAFKAMFELNNTALFDYQRQDGSQEEIICRIVGPSNPINSQHSFICKANTREEKLKWLNLLHKTIEESKSNKISNLNVSVVVETEDERSTFSTAANIQRNAEFTMDTRACIEEMKNGATMLKYCRNTKPHFRTIVLSKNERFLMWGSPNKASHESKVAIADIITIKFGQKTDIFGKGNPEHEPLSFSLVYKNRSLDLVAKDKREFAVWTVGIKELMERCKNQQHAHDDHNEDGNIVLHHDLNKEKQKFKEMYERIGDAYTWGQGSRGALGHGDESDQTIPLVMKDFLYLDVSSMACENSAAAALMLTGELFTWGSGEKGRLGHGDTADRVKPALVKELEKHPIMKVAMGTQHTLALENTGTVWGFGSSEFGQLGMGTEFSGASAIQSKPIILPALAKVKVRDIACGHCHSACITMEGEVLIWGRGEDGQLGLGHKNNVFVPTSIPRMEGFRIIEVALGLWHSMLLTEKGQVWSFGNSTYGQLGHGNLTEQLTPVLIQELESKRVVSIAAGSAHSVCILESGEIYCWGSGIYGQIGNNEKEHATKPVLVKNLMGITAQKIACGVNHTLALMDNGAVYAWGAGTYGRLGLKSENDQHVPKEISFLADKSVRTIACGGAQSACVCAHQWVPDKDATACMNCNATFTFIKRRHHCRYCGGIFCGTCTSKRKAILRFGFDDPVRVCDYCFQILNS